MKHELYIFDKCFLLLLMLFFQSCNGQNNTSGFELIKSGEDSVAKYSEIIKQYDLGDSTLIVINVKNNEKIDIIKGSRTLLDVSLTEALTFVEDFQKSKQIVLFVLSEDNKDIVLKYLVKFEEIRQKETKYLMIGSSQYKKEMQELKDLK